MDQEKTIPFMYVLITKSTNEHPSHQVYRKPTHTDRYLNYRSFHHPSILQSVPNTLINRAHAISDQDHLQEELHHIKTTLTNINGYPVH